MPKTLDPHAGGGRKQIKDRTSIADHVADVMAARWRVWSIDTLLCHPVEAIEMALDVGARSGRIAKGRAREIARALAALADEHGEEISAVNEICRAALSSRKRGDLTRDAE